MDEFSRSITGREWIPLVPKYLYIYMCRNFILKSLCVWNWIHKKKRNHYIPHKNACYYHVLLHQLFLLHLLLCSLSHSLVLPFSFLYLRSYWWRSWYVIFSLVNAYIYIYLLTSLFHFILLNCKHNRTVLSLWSLSFCFRWLVVSLFALNVPTPSGSYVIPEVPPVVQTF